MEDAEDFFVTSLVPYAGKITLCDIQLDEVRGVARESLEEAVRRRPSLTALNRSAISVDDDLEQQFDVGHYPPGWFSWNKGAVSQSGTPRQESFSLAIRHGFPSSKPA